MTRLGLLLALIIVTGVPLTAQTLRFEVASIKPTTTTRISQNPIPLAQPGGRFKAGLATVGDLLWFAYDLQPYRIVGGPDWVREDRFEINAKAETDAPADQIKLRVQSLLKDRFKLVTHTEQREMSLLALVPARPNGPLGLGLVRIDECSPAIVNKLRRDFPEKYPTPGGGMASACSSKGLGDLAVLLTMWQGTPIIDATGLTDSFYFTIRSQSPNAALIGRSTSPNPDLPALSTALAEQLGLRLQSRRGPVEVLVIDSVERPTPD